MLIKGFNFKKIRIPAAAVLLFLGVTAIIIFVLHGMPAEQSASVMGIASGGEHILVIDAGHGGLDGGASAADGTTESVINLAIALRMDQLAKLFGLPAVMTRSSEELDYPKEAGTIHAKKVWDQKKRVELINGTENAVLISIHQNRYPDPRPRGSQALYAKTAGSKELAELVHTNLVSCLNPENRRVAAPISDSIYLMKNIRHTGILVECGFLSNTAEAEQLKNSGYQKSLAVVLIGSYLQYIDSPAG